MHNLFPVSFEIVIKEALYPLEYVMSAIENGR